MTIPENPISTLWQWVARAPLPVVMALLAALSSWVWAIDSEQAAQRPTVAVAAEQAKTAADTTKRVEEKLDRLLEIVLKNEAEKAAAEKAAAKVAADNAVKKEKK